MDFATMKTRLSDRGFDYLSDTRRAEYINNAFHELEEAELWPFREASASGTAPLTIADLGTIEQVINVDNSYQGLAPAEYGELVGMFGDLDTTGTPEFYYVGWPSDEPVVATFPESSDTIGVQYYSVSDDMSADGDTPSIPTRYHKLIVDLAVREAYRDSDNHQAAEQLQAQIDRDLARMRSSLLTGQVQGPGFVRIVNGSEDS